ncbi:MAG: DSD1 family PLP-dependent enzyme [Gammaproteobacteria bacterium]|nr:MAG: DSD1 family PLP-dependent enzyme [Gammaproteobacteria bacterium]
MTLQDLSTPALVLDRRILGANTTVMTERMRRLGVRLRPHLKTAKSVEVARLALGGNFGGITVSTLREAAYFLEHGITDITYAVGIVPARLDAAASLCRQGADLKITTDNTDVARAIVSHGAQHMVLIEIDTGDKRGGVAPEADELLEIARILDEAPAVTLTGVLTHAGQSYDCRDGDAIAVVAEDERAGAVLAAERLRAVGLPCPVVSVGSTPTAMFARDLSGVTEMRPGVYMFCDLFQAGIGVCRIEDIAVSVLASVIGHRRADNILLIDAGALALSKDRSTAELRRDCGYGLLCDADTGEALSGLRVHAVNQEHGFVTSDQPVPFNALPIGAKVRVLPNHACMTAAAYDRYYVVDGGTEVVATWPRCNGW